MITLRERNRRTYDSVRMWGALLAISIAGAAPAVGAGPKWVETPMLADRVASGQLPPIEDRLPEHPSVVSFEGSEKKPGVSGGNLRILMGNSKDVRMMVVYGYARLVGYNERYEIVPDILESIDVEDGRSFTLHLRRGHRWSDGHPFTSEDFRYFWDNIASNEQLEPFGPPSVFMVEGEPPKFELIDEATVRYTWTKPNPFFLEVLAGARPEAIYAPAHYLKQFHADFADVEKLEALASEEERQGWYSVHIARFRPYKNINPDLPSLDPWINTTRPPSQRFVFERNPYFHRVDDQGHQLPYIDQVVMTIVGGKLIPAKTGAGESDLQARSLSFTDYTFLKESEGRTGNVVHLWETTKGSHIALFPNLTVNDPVWRTLMRDVRFRVALSHAIDRDEINQVIYYGLATPGNDTVHERSPLSQPEYRTRGTEFDLAKANALLDEVGLIERDAKGIRLLPDGRPLQIIVETAGEDTEQIDVLELIRNSWRKAGIELFSKPLQREVFRNRIFSGETLMSVWGGLENGLPTAQTSPRELAPTAQEQLQWPKWGQYFETAGGTGEAVDLPAAAELLRLNSAWLEASDPDERAAIWQRMLEIRAEQMFSIGIVAGVPQPVVASSALHNCPARGVYNWDPGAHFGIYRPDTFWLSKH